MEVMGTPLAWRRPTGFWDHRQLQRDRAQSRQGPALRRLLAAGDAAAVLLARRSRCWSPDCPRRHIGCFGALSQSPLMMVLFKLYGLYDRDVKRISYSTVDDLPWLFHATVIGGLICGCTPAIRRCTGSTSPRSSCSGSRSCALVTPARFGVRSVVAGLIGVERALLVGTGDLGQTLVGKLAAHPEYRLDVIGSLSPADASPATTADGPGARHARAARAGRRAARRDPRRVLRSRYRGERAGEDAARLPGAVAEGLRASTPCRRPRVRPLRSTTSRASRSSASTLRGCRAPPERSSAAWI